VRCAKCGNENSENNRFCGMCGATLIGNAPPAKAAPVPVPKVIKPEPSPVTPAIVVPTTAPVAPAPVAPEPELRFATRLAPPAGSSRTSQNTTPSFLGLNDPVAGPAADVRDSRERSSGNLDYLLEDDEEEPKRGWGKLLLVVIALALAGGFGYLRWKQGGFDWVTGDKKPAVESSQTTPDAGGSSAPTPGGVNSSTPDSSTASSTAPASTATPNAGATPQTATPGSSIPGAGSSPVPPDALPTTAPPAAQNLPADSVPQTKAADADTEKAPAPDADAEAGAASAKPEAAISRRPQRKPTPITPADSTAEAERYIYGRGVRQDCDRGLRMLKPAAQSNPKAMITLGTLYSNGTCTPRDLPTAYRWFAMALHKQPDNLPLQNDLQKLWGQMTQPERQLAIKLSQ
jgi:hypothetical protein